MLTYTITQYPKIQGALLKYWWILNFLHSIIKIIGIIETVVAIHVKCVPTVLGRNKSQSIETPFTLVKVKLDYRTVLYNITVF